MFKFSVSLFLISVCLLISSKMFGQTSNEIHYLHVQTLKLNALLQGDDAKAFSEMLQRQGDAATRDPRVISFKAARHSWGHDSRDLVLIAEFKSRNDLFSFYDEFNSMLEKAFSKEQMDKDNALWAKYVGEHSDEIYQVIASSKK